MPALTKTTLIGRYMAEWIVPPGFLAVNLHCIR